MQRSESQCPGLAGTVATFVARWARSASAARWRDTQRLARFYELLAARLTRVYQSGATGPQIQAARNDVFRDALEQMAGPLAAELETIDGRRLAEA